jgi:hypothetical protein
MLASDIQERRNKRSLIVLATLIGLSVATFFLIRQSDKPAIDKSIFRDFDSEIVDRVRIESPQDTIELTFENSRWKVNKEYPADRNLVTLLFATIKQAEPKREIVAGSMDSTSTAIEKSGQKITLYAEGQPIRSFIAAGNPTKTQSFFKDSKTGKVYVMSIPGYRVYVAGIFEMKTGGWRDKFVFGTFNWRNFQSLEARFPERPSENFKVQAEGTGLFGIAGIKTDTARLNTFLDDVSLLAVDDYLESARLKDSLTQVKPFLNLIITDIASKQQILSVYRENKNGVLGMLGNNQPVLFNPETVRNVIRSKSFFVQK